MNEETGLQQAGFFVFVVRSTRLKEYCLRAEGCARVQVNQREKRE
jgi:hypothetical protein